MRVRMEVVLKRKGPYEAHSPQAGNFLIRNRMM